MVAAAADIPVGHCGDPTVVVATASTVERRGDPPRVFAAAAAAALEVHSVDLVLLAALLLEECSRFEDLVAAAVHYSNRTTAESAVEVALAAAAGTPAADHAHSEGLATLGRMLVRVEGSGSPLSVATPSSSDSAEEHAAGTAHHTAGPAAAAGRTHSAAVVAAHSLVRTRPGRNRTLDCCIHAGSASAVDPAGRSMLGVVAHTPHLGCMP